MLGRITIYSQQKVYTFHWQHFTSRNIYNIYGALLIPVATGISMNEVRVRVRVLLICIFARTTASIVSDVATFALIQGNVVKKPRCSFTGRPGRKLSSAPKKDGAKPAALPKGVRLWEKRELSVQIINPDLLTEWNRDSTSTTKITPDQIIEWANKWQRKLAHKYTVYVPKFRLAGQNENADVVIELNGMVILGNTLPTHYLC